MDLYLWPELHWRTLVFSCFISSSHSLSSSLLWWSRSSYKLSASLSSWKSLISSKNHHYHHYHQDDDDHHHWWISLISTLEQQLAFIAIHSIGKIYQYTRNKKRYRTALKAFTKIHSEHSLIFRNNLRTWSFSERVCQ